jgi:enamine deaminase RidA (YjgF/YER057c/UK114 family)
VVANGASELFLEIFGERGAHARSTFGSAQIPFGACVEIDLIAEVIDRADGGNSIHQFGRPEAWG